MTRATPVGLPPHDDRDAVVAWVRDHLGHLVCDPEDGGASARWRGGDTAARRALAELDVNGYARRRNEVWPMHHRGATGVSPYVRHGLITLAELWEAAADAPERDRDKYRDELLWQEYARHLYARTGARSADDLRHRPSDQASSPGAVQSGPHANPFDDDLECIRRTVAELHTDGWLVNQTRMWLASHWAVRHEVDWQRGEDHFFRHLLDGSRAANRLGWQWTAGRLTGSAYGFSRRQVERRAPDWCATCPRAHDCPIEQWPTEPALERTERHDVTLARHGGADDEAGPITPESATGAALDAVWLTAESLTNNDPARRANPDLPAVFVFDEPLLGRLRLSTKRLVFLTECLTDPGLADAGIEVHLGDPVEVLSGVRLATTFTPVPGGRRRRAALDVRELHPWPWLRRPDSTPVTSFSAWRRSDPANRAARRPSRAQRSSRSRRS